VVSRGRRRKSGAKGASNARRKSARRGDPAPAVPASARDARPLLVLSWSDASVAVLLFLLVLSAYGGTLDAPFVYDDHGSVVENASVHWHEVGVEELRAAWLQSPTRRLVANWSFGLNHRFFGLDPRAYHATNLIIHTVACVLLYWLLLQLLWRERPTASDARLAAALAAGVFAVHPVGTQAVTYVVQRMASLAGLFCVLSLLLYARGRGRSGRERVTAWLGAGVAWSLALASKESAATFPAVIALYEWLFHRGAERAVALRLLGGVMLAAGVGFVVMQFNYADPFRDSFYHDFTLGDRLLSQARVLGYYVGLIAWPSPSRLTLMHDFPPSLGLLAPWTTVPAWLALGLTLLWAARSVGRRPLWVFALGWFGLALAVETSIFPLRLVHEHRLYLPLMGVSIALAAGLHACLPAHRALTVAVGCVVLSVLVLATRERNEVWLDRGRVWQDVIEKSPGLGIGYANLAAVHILNDRYEDAEEVLQRGQRADPSYPGIERGLALVRAIEGEEEEALSMLQRVVAQDPLDHAAIGQIGVLLVKLDRDEEALQYFEESTRIFEHPRVVNHHGKALVRLGRPREAIPLHRRALRLAPDDGFVLVALGHALASVGSVEEARPLLERAVNLEDPTGARIELANMDWVGGRPASAIAHLRDAMRDGTRSAVVRNNLAWMLATVGDSSLRDPQGAVALVAEAQEDLDQADPDLLDAKAAAEAAAGDLKRAASTASEAVAVARSQGNEALADDIEARLAGYRRGEVYVDPLSLSVRR